MNCRVCEVQLRTTNTDATRLGNLSKGNLYGGSENGPVIVAKTPLRISFFGGGSDYPEVLGRLCNGGRVLGCAIDKYTYVTVNRGSKLSPSRFRVSYSKIEQCDTLEEIEHPAVRETLRYLDFQDPLEIYVVADLPSRSGLGSSSSFTVCLLHALHSLQGRFVGPLNLAKQAIHIERELIQERVGLQDQHLCALGGFKRICFWPGSTEVCPVSLKLESLREVEQRLILFYTGIRRTAHEILDEQMKKSQSGVLDEAIQRLVDQAVEAEQLLVSGHYDEFGRLLHQTWLTKRSLSSKVSNAWIDECYEKALQGGALGGKLLGAGSGGFLLFYCPPQDQPRLRAALEDLVEVPIRLGQPGSQIIFSSVT